MNPNDLETYMPLAELDTPAKAKLPAFKPELSRVGARVVALHQGQERRGTVTYVANFNAIIRPDDGGHAFKVNARDVLHKAPPIGEEGYRGEVTFTGKTLGQRVTFHVQATTTAMSMDAACQKIIGGARLMFPFSCERTVYGVRPDPDVVE